MITPVRKILVSKCHCQFLKTTIQKNNINQPQTGKMFKKNAISQSSLLQDMVRVKKIRFKDEEKPRVLPVVSRDAFQKRANFQEFREVYGDCLERKSKKVLEKDPCLVHKTKSGSLCKNPKVRKDPQFVDTITLELPLHYGGDRAVQLLENKIKPKKSVTKVHRSIVTDNIARKLQKIEEEAELEERSTADITKTQSNDIEKQMKTRKEAIWRNLPRVALQKPKRRVTKDKIMNELNNINEKLRKMQQKYIDQPKVQFKSVNDCFTQSGNIDIIFENEDYLEKIKRGSEGTVVSLQKASKSSSGQAVEDTDSKIEDSLKELNELFPEFPKIEDTLKEIETHLDNIVNLKVESGSLKQDESKTCSEELETGSSRYWARGDLESVLGSMERKYFTPDSSQILTNRILRGVGHARDAKLRTIRKEIEEVEDFCDKISEIANEDNDVFERDYLDQSDRDSRISEGQRRKLDLQIKEQNNEEEDISPSKIADIVDFKQDPDLQKSIKKSNYLTKEFGNIQEYVDNPLVKVFSDNDKRIVWRKKMRALESETSYDSKDAESVTKMINSLKFTLENSLYEPVV